MIPIAKPYLTEEEAKAAHDVVLTGWVTQGPKVIEFEENFAKYTGAKHAVAVSSCTTALHLAMIVSGIGAGDEVICPSMSYIATANSIKYTGAMPVFAEVNKDYNIDVKDAKRKITDKTKAILIVHQMGMPADIDAFKELCNKYNLKLIEDAACAAGAEYKGNKIGSHSELVCFSFHPRKVITTGDGGMITTSNTEYYERLKRLRQHGMTINDRERHEATQITFEEHPEIGYNYRMTDIQAAVGIKQLEKLDWLIKERRKIADIYKEELGNLECLRHPNEIKGIYTNWQSYCIYLNDKSKIKRNDLMQELFKRGVSTRRGIMCSHLEKAYRENGTKLKITEDLFDNSIIIPLFVPQKDEETEKVIKSIKELV